MQTDTISSSAMTAMPVVSVHWPFLPAILHTAQTAITGALTID